MTYDPSDTNENDNTADGDVTFQAVNTEQQSITNGPTTETRTLEASDSDGDDATTLSLTASGIGPVEEAVVVVDIDCNGTSDDAPLQITKNGAGTGEYNQTVLSGGTVTQQNSVDSWSTGVFDQETTRHRFRWTTGVVSYFKQLSGGFGTRDVILKASEQGSQPTTLDSVSVNTGFDASGSVYVIGVSK